MFVVAEAFFCARAEPANEAQQFVARTWQTDDGLPRNTITAIAQSPQGYLWLGTRYGLIRFDGVTFTPIEDDTFAGLARARTRVLYTDRFGRLWIGTGTDGIIRYDGNAFTVIDSRNGLPHPTITAICEDFKGTVWVASQDGSLSWVDAEDRVHPIPRITDKSTPATIQLVRDARGTLWYAQRNHYGQLQEGLATNVVQIPNALVMLCPSRDGGMWVSGGTELQKLPSVGGGGAVQPVALPVKPNQVTSLLEDSAGNLWIGSQQQGVIRYADGKFSHELESTHRISALYQDTESNLWVGTEGGGISRLRPEMFRRRNVREDDSPSMIFSVCESADGNMWLAAQGPILLNRDAIGHSESIPAFTNIAATCVLPNPEGGVWVGTVDWGLFSVRDGQEMRLTDYKAFRNLQIRSLHRDTKGQLWMGCLPSGLAKLSGGKVSSPTNYFDQGLPKHAIWAIADDRDGNLWLGTLRGELWRYDGTAFSGFGPAQGLPGASISALHMTAEGDLWIGTLGGGLGRLRDGHFVFAGVRHGLADNVITTIADDGLGFFWLGSERGIFRVKRQDLDEFADGKRSHFESFRYGKDDGLMNVECNGGYQPSAWRTRSGEIWFATSKGAVLVEPASIQAKSVPSSLVLEKILLDDVLVTNRTNLTIAYGYQKLEFVYAAPSFTAPEQIHFRHQLEGLDPDWVATDTTRAASYPRLAPGRYVFRFTACNLDGVWNDQPAAFTFEVTPAYWQTVWFKAAILCLFTAVVASAVRFRYVQKMRRKLQKVEQARAVERERMRIARDIHDDLGARLTQMAFLSELTASELGPQNPSGERLEKIATGSRQAIRSLEEIVWAVNPRKDSLSDFLDFLSHYANEFFRATEIRCRQDLPLIIPDIPLSAEVRHHLFLACKETLNNIHKHAGATEVWLCMKMNKSDFELMIKDNGQGFQSPSNQSAGNGLLNLQTRLTAIGGQCQVDSQPGRGTCVRLSLKLPDHVITTNFVPTADQP